MKRYRNQINPAVKFEQRIQRIHQLLEATGSDVTWNDHIADPDNPAQRRQIDITVKNDVTFTLIECRLRTARQNVTWVEELAGRKISLRADQVIGVSASGFTKGAVLKAKKLGIILRDIKSLGENEISSWGNSLRLNIFFL